mmetsp:Transcript_104496/g.180483  ORF Transcript_104496/g.180483 Transcript_104496/m.180483 type:complete len:1003 (+) Transcript_104496:110-3118(+)
MFYQNVRMAFRTLSANRQYVAPIAAAAVAGTTLMTSKPTYMWSPFFSSKKEMIFQLGTNNWQRPKKDGSGLEFAPGSGVLHEAHHNAYNLLGTVKSYSVYPSSTQGQPTDPKADYKVFELDHPIPICESASPNSSKRWHGMDDKEFGAYCTRLENEVYDYMKVCEAQAGSKFTMAIAHHSFVNPLVLSKVLARRAAEGLPKIPLYCFVHGTALKMYRWELGGKAPEEFPLRFHKMILEEKLFDDVENGVNACFVISEEQKGGIAEIFPSFPQARVIVAPNGINVEKFKPREKGMTQVITEQTRTVLWPAVPSEGDCKKFTSLITFVGKYAEWKRLAALLYAAAEYEKAYPNNVTLCVGTGPDAEIDKAKKLCEELQLKNTFLIGARGQDILAELYTVSSLGCFPSFREPFGLVFVECMACKTPVIGANSGGPVDFVAPEVGELVTEPPETTDLSTVPLGVKTLGKTLNEAICRALKEDWKSSKGEACIKLALDKFTVGAQVSKMLTDVALLDCAGSMPVAAMKYLLARPQVPAPLDPNFAPLVLGKRNYLKAVAGCKDNLEWALPRADGCARYKMPVFPESHPDVEASVYLAGVLIQEMIWQRSASSLLLSGPPKICSALVNAFSKGGAYEFEVMSMPNVCGTPEKPFTVKIVKPEELPPAADQPQVCGKDANGCRLAFDLGKSDIKTVAVKDGEVVYSKETEWDVTNPDPDYHFKAIVDALKLAKAPLPKVDAMGGSATGTVGANNEATWCDIFPNVPADVYKAKVVDIFQRITKEVCGDVPLKVINDGEVTALAAVQKLGKGNIMGISMGSSEGGGYANADGNLLGWINELCYCRLDLNPEAPTDPWTKGAHRGISHMYLGQRGATRLAAKAGVKVPDNYVYPHPDMCTITHENHAQCLKLIQKAMADPMQAPKVRRLYETVGVYLGYGLAQYCEFYPIDHVMILGRVSKGSGGDLMLDTAKKVLETEFPEFAGIQFHTADDHFKAVGQCIAAAALPTIG